MRLSAVRQLLPLAAALVCATPAAADPSLWKISDTDSSVFLFGSMHAFPRAVDWRSAQFDHLLETAEHVYFEVVMDVEAYSTIAYVSMTKGRITDGGTLSDLLTRDQNQRLAEALAKLKLDPRVFAHLQPWMANMTIAGAALPQTTAGVELQVEPEVEAARKRGLETADQQMGFLADVPLQDQVVELMSSVDGVNSGAMMDLEPMLGAWEDGDTAALDAAMSGYMTADDKPLYDRLITRRNESWIPAIEKMLAANDQSLLIVGAGHLVGGGGVPALLEAAGYTVERIDALPAESPPAAHSAAGVKPR